MARGKNIPMTGQRSIVCDLTDIARRAPLVPIQRKIDVSDLRDWRSRVRPRISWQVIMMRAYALTSMQNPVLRQSYVPFPWPHFYQHHESVCLLMVQRQVEGVDRLMFARFARPEYYSLLQLQEIFNELRRRPIDQIRQLQHQVWFARLPWLIRKVAWRLMTDWLPARRATHMGTFGMSLSTLRGTHGTFHLGPCSTILGYDQLCRDGTARITLTFDHRILDGKPAMDALDSFRKHLQTTIRNELRDLAREQLSPDRHELPGDEPAAATSLQVLRPGDPERRQPSGQPAPFQPNRRAA